MSIAEELAGPSTPVRDLSLVQNTPLPAFPLTKLEKDGIELFLLSAISTKTFVNVYSGPTWGPIGEKVYERSYARDVPVVDTDGNPVLDADGDPVVRKEQWAETVRRVVIGNLAFAPEHTQLTDEAIELFWAIYKHRIMPGGRHLWVTGTRTKSSMLSRNCWVSGWSRTLGDHFRYLSARLFEGGGVGANYSSDLIASTPPVLGNTRVRFTCRADHADLDKIIEAAGDDWVEPGSAAVEESGWNHIYVEDTREGWTDVWGTVIDNSTRPVGNRYIIDVSDVRAHGAPLRSFGGKASGPAPLVEAVTSIVDVLNRAAADERRISGVEAMEIDHAIARSVVAGGTRRSARLAAMHWADPEIFDFINAKATSGNHWSANISVEIDENFAAALDADDDHAVAVLNAVAAGMAANGEPGFIDTGFMSADEPKPIRVTNPCGEATLSFDSTDAAGESCNLGSVNLDAFGTDVIGAQHAFRLLARFLYRATMNLHPDRAAGRIEAKNRRLGVGIMGVQGWTLAHGVRLSELAANTALLNNLSAFRAETRRSADELADTLGLPRPVKVTAIAPTGTIAQLAGCTPGIHAVTARRFIRRVRYASSDPRWISLEAEGYHVEDAINEPDTKVVDFVVKDAMIDRFGEELVEQENEISFDQFNDLIAAIQATFCATGDGQSISATAAIPVDMDPVVLSDGIRKALGRVKGITAFPQKSHEQAPYETLTVEQFNAYVDAGYPISDGGDSNDGNCGVGGCPIR